LPPVGLGSAGNAAFGLKDVESESSGLSASGQHQLERRRRQVGDRDGDPRLWLRLVLPFGDDHSLDACGRHCFEAHREYETGRVDDLDLLADPRPQRAGEVAGIAALDYRAIALTSRKKSWQSLCGSYPIALNVS
jgi:hypothetical protein